MFNIPDSLFNFPGSGVQLPPDSVFKIPRITHGDTYDERKTCFDTLRKAYGLASSILHGRGLKRKNREEDAGTVGRAQELCREALLRMVREGALPNWDEVVLGKVGDGSERPLRKRGG